MLGICRLFLSSSDDYDDDNDDHWLLQWIWHPFLFLHVSTHNESQIPLFLISFYFSKVLQRNRIERERGCIYCKALFTWVWKLWNSKTCSWQAGDSGELMIFKFQPDSEGPKTRRADDIVLPWKQTGLRAKKSQYFKPSSKTRKHWCPSLRQLISRVSSLFTPRGQPFF